MPTKSGARRWADYCLCGRLWSKTLRFNDAEGNTGGADVSAMQPMPLPADLRAILDADRSG